MLCKSRRFRLKQLFRYFNFNYIFSSRVASATYSRDLSWLKKSRVDRDIFISRTLICIELLAGPHIQCSIARIVHDFMESCKSSIYHAGKSHRLAATFINVQAHFHWCRMRPDWLQALCETHLAPCSPVLCCCSSGRRQWFLKSHHEVASEKAVSDLVRSKLIQG